MSDNEVAKTQAVSYHELEKTWGEFSERVRELFDELNLGLLDWQCDHVALRVNTVANADQLKQDFLGKGGKVLSENRINGRPILIFALPSPLILNTLATPCVELPYPGDKIYSKPGWEHIELVFPSTAQDCDVLEKELVLSLPHLKTVLNGEKEEIKIKKTTPKGDRERLANPTIAFKKGNICIKIHPRSIQEIIASEQMNQPRVTDS
ncbi:VOC family protein [Piscirickettsia litoralis]|uniref:VOC family protein n=1 Tax=Piscirickettsia litoralis TaxID=1891921 RepID=A0ABX2ZZN2_9GAMM|nr:VOC family protein [Piscirickettsia litoralis]ODN42049.1 hypothetical protein BGC07_02620 [Piscirickettsia litoralis]